MEETNRSVTHRAHPGIDRTALQQIKRYGLKRRRSDRRFTVLTISRGSGMARRATPCWAPRRRSGAAVDLLSCRAASHVDRALRRHSRPGMVYCHPGHWKAPADRNTVLLGVTEWTSMSRADVRLRRASSTDPAPSSRSPPAGEYYGMAPDEDLLIERLMKKRSRRPHPGLAALRIGAASLIVGPRPGYASTCSKRVPGLRDVADAGR